ncbi:aspartate 1-decarboxylase [Verrucomicrobiota bacterium]
MLSVMLKSKLHHATVTDVELEYEGSLTIDSNLMDAAGIRPYEKILIANLANGNRFETYAIPAEESGSGKICLNGATAHKGSSGDRLIVFAFGLLQEEEINQHRPRVILLDENNKIKTAT